MGDHYACFFLLIRVLEEEIDSLRHEHNCCRQNLERISGIIQKNECEFRTEETKLSATRREASLIIEKIRVVESQQEPEPADVLVFVSTFECFVMIVSFL